MSNADNQDKDPQNEDANGFRTRLENNTEITLPIPPLYGEHHPDDTGEERLNRLYYRIKGIPYQTHREALDEGKVYSCRASNKYYLRDGNEFYIQDINERRLRGNNASKPVNPKSTPGQPTQATDSKRDLASKSVDPETHSRRTTLIKLGVCLAASTVLGFLILSRKQERQEISATSSALQKIADFISSLKPGLLDEKISPYNDHHQLTIASIEDKHSGLSLRIFLEKDQVSYALSSATSDESIHVVITSDDIYVKESVTCHLTAACGENQPDSAEFSATPPNISNKYSASVSDFEDFSAENRTLLKSLKLHIP